MNPDSKIYLAGHTGLVGSALYRGLTQRGYKNIIHRRLDELDLISQRDVDEFFRTERPEYVMLAAAKVGGIVANNTYRAEFIYENLMIQANVIHAAWKFGVKRLLFLGSTCIYPREAPQPMKETYLLGGPLEQTNEPYAIAKIAGLKMCESYNRQYGTDFIAVMPTNLYGPGDNFDLEKSHVLPAILRKMHLASCLEKGDLDSVRKDLNKRPVEGVSGSSSVEEILNILGKYGVSVKLHGSGVSGSQGSKVPEFQSSNTETLKHLNTETVTLTLWGTGTPLREFMYSEEMAAACIHIMENIPASEIVKMNGGTPDAPQFVNIGTGTEITIRDLAYMIKGLTGFYGEVTFDPSKPDGTMRKLTDTTLLKSLGFVNSIDLNKGLGLLYESYLKPPCA